MTRREQALTALHARLADALTAPVLRNEVVPEKIAPEGLCVLRDGDPGEPEVTLSPASYLYEHRAELDVVVTHGDARFTQPPPIPSPTKRRGRPPKTGGTDARQSGEFCAPQTGEIPKPVDTREASPRAGIRSCLGILRLAKDYGAARLDAACRRGNDIGARSYGSIASILKHGLDGVYAHE